MLFSEPVTNQCGGMSGGRGRPPMEDGLKPPMNGSVASSASATDFRVPSATANWLRTTYQIDNAPGGTTTTTRHFAAWEQTTHFPRGHHTHPLLAASASLNASSPSLIRPIPNRLASPPRSPLTSEAKPLASPQGLNLIKLESRPLEIDTDGNDSAFEDWESCSRTTPNNHKSIRKWRQQSQPGGGGHRSGDNPPSASSTPSSNPAMTPISILTSSPLETNGGGPLSAPSVMHSWPHQKGNGSFSPSDSLFTSPASSTSNSDLKRRLKSETVTSPDSVSSLEDNKPIGIAVGRQRTPTTSAEASNLADSGHETSTDKSSLEDSGIELKRPAPPPRPSPVSGLLPPLSPLDCVGLGLRQPAAYWPLPFMAASPPAHQPMPAHATYSVTTKDLYPAMYLYNGFGPLAAAASMWPPPASAFGATPFQQSLIQLQQESWLAASARHGNGFLFNNQPPQESPSPPRRPAAPRPSVPRTPSPVLSPKENGQDHEDNLSVGGPNDELDETCSEASNAVVSGTNNEATKLVKVKVESLKAEKTDDDTSGLQLLTEGIDRLEHSSPRSAELKPPMQQPRRSNKLGILCDAAFLSDDEAHLRSDTISNGGDAGKARSRSLDSPNKKPRTLSSEYRSPKAERNAKAFIASKSLKVSEDLHHLETASSIESVSNGGCNVRGVDRDARMADWERNLRLNLADIQKKYKEKYKELQVINKKSFSTNNKTVTSSVGGTSSPSKRPVQDAKKTLAPITPWLHKLKNGQHHQSSSSNYNNSNSASANNASDKKGNKQDLISNGCKALESPKGPDLSTITSKFRSARPNPFENLLKLSCVGKKSQEGVKKTEDDLEAIEESPAFATSTPKVSNEAAADMTKSDTSKQDLKRLPKLDLVQDDHGDADVSEVDDDDQEPPVLEPMLENEAVLDQGRTTSDKPKNNITVKIKRPPSETDSSGSSHSRSKKSKKEKKAKKAKKDRHHHRDHHKKHHHDVKQASVVHFDDNDADSIHAIDLVNAGITKKKDKKKSCQTLEESASKKPIKEVFIEGPEMCNIKQSDLVDGLRVLVKKDGHFHHAKLRRVHADIPDFYTIKLDYERASANRQPEVYTSDEVLNQCIFEVKPASIEALIPETRVCAYWSNKYAHLYPGSISDHSVDSNLNGDYLNIELDDGDSRDFPLKDIRYLPVDYPKVETPPDAMSTLLSRKTKRRTSMESGTSEGSRAAKTPRASIDEQQPPSSQQQQPQSKSRSLSGDLKMRINVSQSKHKQSTTSKVTSTTASNGQTNTTSVIGTAAKVVRKSGALAQRPSISSASDSDGDGKCGIASFLPKDQVWKWADKGAKRSKGRIYHKKIQRKNETLCTGDSAVFLSTNCPDQPYIGRLETMWETASGAKNVAVRWYYHLAEVAVSEAADRKSLKKLKQPKGALFESNHYDENDVQTISHRCDVLPFEKFQSRISHPDPDEEDSNDKYYLAGSHNAVEKTVQFAPGVLL